MSAQLSNVSSDLIWEVVRNNNSFLAKSKKNGNIQFSRDPLNLINKNTRKHAGFVNVKAIGVAPAEKGGVVVLSKKEDTENKPAANIVKTSYPGKKSSRKTYAAVANLAAKNEYRADLRAEAVSRVSAIRHANKPVKPTPEPKARGKKAKQAAAEEN